MPAPHLTSLAATAAMLQRDNKTPSMYARDSAVRIMRLPVTAYKIAFESLLEQWAKKQIVAAVLLPNSSSTATATTTSTATATSANIKAQQIATTLYVLRLVRAYEAAEQSTALSAVGRKVSAAVTTELVHLATDLVAAQQAYAAAEQHAVAAVAAAAALEKSSAPSDPTVAAATTPTTTTTAATAAATTIASAAAAAERPIISVAQTAALVCSLLADEKSVAAAALYRWLLGQSRRETAKKDTASAFCDFLVVVSQAVVQQCTAAVEAWHDFGYLWQTAWQPHPFLQTTVVAELAARLEPAVPGLPEQVTDGTNQTYWNPQLQYQGYYNNNNNEEEEEQDPAIAPTEASHGSNETRIQTLAWKMACLAGTGSTDRRDRLLQSCAATTLLAVLPLLTGTTFGGGGEHHGHVTADPSAATKGQNGNAEEEEEEPASKRARTDETVDDAMAVVVAVVPDEDDNVAKKKKTLDILQVLLQAANEEAAFTRWACSSLEGYNKIAFDLTAPELAAAILALVDKLVVNMNTELEKLHPNLTQYPGNSDESGDGDDKKDTTADSSSFLKTLSKVAGDAKKLTWFLPSVVENMNSVHLQDFKRQPQAVASIPVLDALSLVSMQGRMEQFCALTSAQPETSSWSLVKQGGRAGVAVVALAGKRTSRTAAKVEKDAASAQKSAQNGTAGPQSPGQILRRAVTPSIITEGMELNEWTVSVLYLQVVKPSRKLKLLLEASSDGEQEWHEVMMPVLNRTLLRLSQSNMADKPTRIAPVSVGMEPEGQVNIHGDLTPDKQLCKAVAALYYHALEAVLFCETERLHVSSHPRIVLNDVFHKALLACCSSVVVKAVGATQKVSPSANLQTLQIYSILHITDSNPYDCLKVSESFLQALTLETARGKLGSPLIFGLPRIMQREMRQTEVQIMDSLLWARDPKFTDSMPDKIDDFEEKTEEKGKDTVFLWPPQVLAPTLREEIEDLGGEKTRTDFPTPDHEDFAEYRCVSYLLRKLLRLAFHRIQALCKVLDVPADLPVAAQVWVAFRYLLRHNIELLFDRHVDHWILCALYGVGKTLKLKPDISFARIIEAYVSVRGQELGDVTCQRIVRHIKISTGGNDNATIGNVIVLYNKVFVPSMKDHLLKSKSLKRSIVEVAEAQATLPKSTVAEKPDNGDASTSNGTTETKTVLHFGKPESKTVEQANDIVAKSDAVVESATESVKSD